MHPEFGEIRQRFVYPSRTEKQRRKHNSGLNIAGFAFAALCATGIALGQVDIAGAQERSTRCEALFRIGSLPDGKPAIVQINDATTMAPVSSDIRKVGQEFSVVGFTSDGEQSSQVTVFLARKTDDVIHLRFKCEVPGSEMARRYTLNFVGGEISAASSLQHTQALSPDLSPTPTPSEVKPAENGPEKRKSGDPLDPYYKHILLGVGALFVAGKAMKLLGGMGFRIRL